MYRDIHVIGVTGKINSGKSTVSRYLMSQCGYTKLAFATRLKNMMLALGCTQDEVYGDLKSQPCEVLCGKTPRYALQTLGTEWGREMISPFLWTKALERDLLRLYLQEGKKRFVIEDLRFPSEADWMMGFSSNSILQVVRDGTSSGSHQSETEMDAIKTEYVIINNGSFDDLLLSIDRTMFALGRVKG